MSPGGRGGRWYGGELFYASCADFLINSGSVNVLELSGPVQASTGIALPLNRLYILDSLISRFILPIFVHDFMPLFYECGSRNINYQNPILKQVIKMWEQRNNSSLSRSCRL